MYQILLLILFFTLTGVSQEEFKSAEFCGECHPEIYQQWQTSLHAKSTTQKDPLFRGMYDLAIAETDGKLTDKCMVCHSPLSTVFLDNSREMVFNQDGVTCQFCHGAAEIVAYHSARDMKIDITTVYSDQPNLENTAHPAAHRDYFFRSEFCLPCHAEMKNTAEIEVCSTGNEWREYLKVTGKDCQDCHLLNQEGKVSHLFPGSHRFELPLNAVDMKLSFNPDSRELLISLTNVGAGHAIPTGTPLRMVFLKITAFDSSGTIIWQNWKNNPIMEDRTAVFMRLLGDEQGNAPVPPWKASQTIYNQRLLPGKQINKRYILPEGNVLEVDVKLIFRYAPEAVLQRLGITDPHFHSERILVHRSMFLGTW
jgi:ssDNA-binding Zn-finger/Zn-ribbon topoisomerase 1